MEAAALHAHEGPLLSFLLVGGFELVVVSSAAEQLPPDSVPSFVLAPDHLGGKHIIQVYF